MQKYAVFGYPIAHSLSPRIHAAFGEQCAIPLAYEAIACHSEQFAETLAGFLSRGGAGANVTLPLKQRALAVAWQSSARALRAGAANTLTARNGQWLADNTDGAGLVADLTLRHRVELRGRRTLVFGAGGAARGILGPLLDAGVGPVTIINRSEPAALELAERFSVQHAALEQLPTLGKFDLLIQASSHGHQLDTALPWPEQIADASAIAYDLSYGKAALPLLRWASEVECRGFDGLGMLIEQAAEAFEIWHAVRPDTRAIWGELRAL